MAGTKPRNVPPGAQPFTISATPFQQFRSRDSSARIGPLEFRGGLELRASTSLFGGISGLSVNGDHFVAVSDAGQWITGRFQEEGGRLAGLDDLTIAPMMGLGGKTLMSQRRGDTESLFVANGVAYVGVEGANEVRRFPLGRDMAQARGDAMLLPAEVRKLPRNQGFEALALGAAGTPLAGALVAISESGKGEDGPASGFLVGGTRPGRFAVRRSGDYDITDVAVLPDGDLVLLERRFSIFRGIGMRLRRIAAGAVKSGALVDGPVLMEAGGDCRIDNMEALAISRNDQGETILTIMSDDNFSALQRNLILRFALAGPS
jgi:hypothetical protein